MPNRTTLSHAALSSGSSRQGIRAWLESTPSETVERAKTNRRTPVDCASATSLHADVGTPRVEIDAYPLDIQYIMQSLPEELNDKLEGMPELVARVMIDEKTRCIVGHQIVPKAARHRADW